LATLLWNYSAIWKARKRTFLSILDILAREEAITNVGA
jgi:hypothetical protein